MKNKFLSMLGLSRKAGKLSPGHDAAFDAISKNKAKVCFLTEDASQRLKAEFDRTCNFEKRNIPCYEIPFVKEELSLALGIRAAVLTVNDSGFASELITLMNTINSGKSKEDNI